MIAYCVCVCVCMHDLLLVCVSIIADTFARSCPQTEMERLKARYLKEETSYVSQSSTLSSTDVSSHDLSNVELKRSQNYHSVDSDEDEDVYLYFDTLSDASLDKLSPSSSAKVFQAYTPSCDDRDSAHLKPGLHHNSPSVGTYHSGSLKDVLYSVVSCSPSSCDMSASFKCHIFLLFACVHRLFRSIMSSD